MSDEDDVVSIHSFVEDVPLNLSSGGEGSSTILPEQHGTSGPHRNQCAASLKHNQGPVRGTWVQDSGNGNTHGEIARGLERFQQDLVDSHARTIENLLRPSLKAAMILEAEAVSLRSEAQHLRKQLAIRGDHVEGAALFEAEISALRLENQHLRAQLASAPLPKTLEPKPLTAILPRDAAATDRQPKSPKHANALFKSATLPGSVEPPELIKLSSPASPQGSSSVVKPRSRFTVSRISMMSGRLRGSQKSMDELVMTSAETSASTQNLGRKSASSSGSKKRPRHAQSGQVFCDVEAMKARIHEAISKPEYSVFEFYHTEGIIQQITKSSRFENMSLTMIFLNAAWIAVDSDLNNEAVITDAEPIFQVAEHFFCSYFFVEIILRFLSFKRKRDTFRDAWFVFDAFQSAILVLDTWVFSLLVMFTKRDAKSGILGNASVLKIARCVRLLKMARISHLLCRMPELMVLIKGMLVAFRSVFFTLALLTIILYVFSIVFIQLAKGTSLEQTHFPSVADTMTTLLLGAIIPDQASLIKDVGKEHVTFAFVAVGFILLGSMTVMNMLTGVIVEVVSCVSSVEKEQMLVSYVKQELEDLYALLDVDSNGMVSKTEFQQLLEQPEAVAALHRVGVDVVGLIDVSDFLFEATKELTLPDFLELVLQLRGTNYARVRDIIDMRKFMVQELIGLQNSFTDLDRSLDNGMKALSTTRSLPSKEKERGTIA